ncbi:MAG: protein kinase [bacterium]
MAAVRERAYGAEVHGAAGKNGCRKMIGKIISHYKILEKLGEGGMGVVYKAEDTKLKRTVALKFLTAQALGSEEEKTRFVHEAQAAAALNHPNICTIYEIDEADGHSFIAMEYIEGQSLHDIVRDNLPKVQNLRKVLDYTIQIAEGLQEAHNKGIVHRDIKSANVMVSDNGQAKIMDFGLARLTGGTIVTKEGTTLGTIAYMSPEQARGERVDSRSDIWSFGVLLYEVITGQLPFKGDYEQAVVYSIMNEDAEPITGLRTGVPMELEQIVNKAVAKDADERYQHADEMLVDLRRVRKEIETGASKLHPAIEKQPLRKRAVRYGSFAILGLLLVLAGMYFWQKIGDQTSELTDSREKIRLAVLPFDNITHDPQDEYFADGMTDEMISKLSKIAGFGVIARTSVMHYKTAPKTISEIGQELRVSKILEGSVRKAADKLRITVQLVDVKTQEPIWSDDYDRQLADVFAIQSEVAQQVASALRVELSPTEKRQIEKRGTENLEAYNLYLQGNYYANKRTSQGLNKGIEYFKQAIKIDSEFAFAYAALAQCYFLIGNYGYVPPSNIFPRAKTAAVHALEIDDLLAEAHTELANIRFWFDWDWPSAENTFKYAIKINPDYAQAHRLYAAFLTRMGRHDEAIGEIKRAQELDPLELMNHTVEGYILYYARRYDQSIEQLNKTIEMEPNFFVPYLWLGLAYVEKGMLVEASIAVQKGITLSRGNPNGVALLGYIHAISGKRNEAQKILDQLHQLSQQRYIKPSLVATIHIGLGENDKAFGWLEKAYEARDNFLVYLKVMPSVDHLRSDPRFTALLKKMGLED